MVAAGRSIGEPRPARHLIVTACSPNGRWPGLLPFPPCYFAQHSRELRGLFDRAELFNAGHLFSWVAEAGLPAVACADLHRAENFPGWTTLVPCEQDE
jgi:hypothetical protein